MNKCVKVVFDTNDTGKKYDFKNDIKDLAVNDKVVVDTRFGLTIATVCEVHEYLPKATMFVVQKIDVEAHKQRLERETKMKAIKDKMEARRKKLQEIEIYQILAKEDTEMAKLLAEYSEMN